MVDQQEAGEIDYVSLEIKLEMIIKSVESWNALWDHFGVSFNGPNSGAVVHVLRKCNQCGRILKTGGVKEDLMHNFSFNGFLCRKHGEVEPFYIRDYHKNISDNAGPKR